MLIKGPSGIGKTTLLHLIAGLFLPDEGEVIIGGKALGKLSDNERSELRRSSVGIIFQKLNLIEHLTVLENAELQARGGKDLTGKSMNALEKVGMSALSGQLSASLSLGEQQRVAVARVLSFSPDIVLADEPTSSLDENNSNIIMDSLINLPEETTLITVSHDHRIEKRFSRIINFSELS
ncbi:MAG: ATP-binding cassette domain-containing protein [Bacteroidetes bacterium]|nr:ATP-binding cassette domain-containing protein [Bacteroidota bacterium]